VLLTQFPAASPHRHDGQQHRGHSRTIPCARTLERGGGGGVGTGFLAAIAGPAQLPSGLRGCVDTDLAAFLA
jgi:hypothetical protein